MRNQTIARNYAEALLALAQKADALDGWGAMVGGLADAMQRDPRLTNFLAGGVAPACGRFFGDTVGQ